jgi:hypothetical protein
VFFFLLAGHAFADYPLQAGPMATCKCRHSVNPVQKDVPWFYWMTAHAFIHGGLVGAIALGFGHSTYAAIWVGVLETLLHFIIDVGKCEKYYNIGADQTLHVLCKVAWWLLLTRGVIV